MLNNNAIMLSKTFTARGRFRSDWVIVRVRQTVHNQFKMLTSKS